MKFLSGDRFQKYLGKRRMAIVASAAILLMVSAVLVLYVNDRVDKSASSKPDGKLYKIVPDKEATGKPRTREYTQEELVKNAIIETGHCASGGDTSDCKAVAPLIIGTFETDKILKIYAAVAEDSYKIKKDRIIHISGSRIPQVFIFNRHQDGTLAYKERIMAKDGSYYGKSIREFTKDKPELAHKLINFDYVRLNSMAKSELNGILDKIKYTGDRDKIYY